MNIWKETLRPVAVLVGICILVGLVLSSVNSLTAPVIAAGEQAERDATCAAVLPEADTFTALDCTVEGVTSALKADNGSGFVFLTKARGYGGDVPAAVSVDPDGNIHSVIMMENSETAGMGQKVTEPEFTDQFAGRAAERIDYDTVDGVTCATISSKAAVKAINAALEAYEQVKGGEAS